MKCIFKIYFTVFLVTCVCLCQTVDDDENRPYEFGFTIENYQHRHEKKDVNGIIQGEFGFITADGIYHVTVYATDENGDFHILSMKNIRVSPPLDQIDGKSKPPTKQQLYSSEKSASKYTTPRARAQFTTQPTIKPACAGCGYVTTPKSPKQQQNTFSFQTPAFQDKNPQKVQYQNFNNLNNGLLPPEQNSYPNKQSGNLVSEKNDYQNNGKNKNEQFGVIEKGNDPSSLIEGNQPPTLSDRRNNNPLSRVSVTNNRIQVPGNPDIPIVDKYPNMKEGLPPGIEEKDIKDLLYKFNYTVGFHGHYERGYKSGAKIGGYFVNGRDGISRIVTYVADENGFRPKVRFVNLGLDSPLTPHEDTEKNFGLKSFEFIWYPIE